MASWLVNKIFGSPSAAAHEEREEEESGGTERKEDGGGRRRRQQQDDAPPRTYAAETADEDNVVASVPGRLMYYSNRQNRMMEHLVGESELRLTRPNPDEEPFAYRIEVVPVGTSEAVLAEDIDSTRTPFVFDQGNHSLMWSSRAPAAAEDRRIRSWSFAFAESVRGTEDEQDFGRAFVRAQVEARRGQAFEKAVGKKAVDHEFLFDSLRVPTTGHRSALSVDSRNDPDYDAKYVDADRMDWDCSDVGEEGDEDDDDLADRGFGRMVTPSRAARSGPAFAAPSPAPGDAERNANMAVGMANNRTFVMRGSKVGVFKHDEDERLEYVGKIPEVRTRDGELFTPSKVQLHERDRRLLMLNPDDDEHIYCLDLETEKMIEQWNVGDQVKRVRNVGAVEKYAQRTDETMVLGTNNVAVFSIDPRINARSKLAQSKVYTSNAAPKFTAVATTDDGYAAVGSQTGEIRLYSAVDKRAKTTLPGLGDPITGMDTTADGQWVLATCDAYLLLANTDIDDGSDKNGFTKPMGANARPPPIKLQLHPHDLAKYNIQEVKFTPARFNIGEGPSVEEWIVTSTGPYIITWNFRSAKRGDVFDYRVKREYQEVVSDQFRFNKDDQVVVALTDDVLMQKRRLRPRHE